MALGPKVDITTILVSAEEIIDKAIDGSDDGARLVNCHLGEEHAGNVKLLQMRLAQKYIDAGWTNVVFSPFHGETYDKGERIYTLGVTVLLEV